MTKHLDVDPNENFEGTPIDTPAPTPIKSKPEPKGLAVREQTGQIALLSMADQLQFANRLLAEGMISETFKTPQQVVIAFQYAKAMGLNELIALRQMYVIKGVPSLYGDAPLALVQRSGQLSKIEEFFINDKFERICVENKNLKDSVYGAVTRVWRRGDDLVQEDFFTLDDLARAGLDNSKFGKKEVWKKFERNMMRFKARSMALKTKFADLISGIAIAEHDYHFSPETPEIDFTNRKPSIADELSEELMNAQKDALEGPGGAEQGSGQRVPGVPGYVGPSAHQEPRSRGR